MYKLTFGLTYSFSHGLADNSSCCLARSYLKMASTLGTVWMLLDSSNVALAVAESIIMSASFTPRDVNGKR